MKCDEYQILIEDYVDGALDSKGAARITSHITECADCAALYRELTREQELYSLYQRDVEVTPVLWASIRDRIREQRDDRPVSLISRLRDRFAGVFAAPRLSPAFAAILVMIAVGVTVFVMSRMNSPQAPTELAAKKEPPTVVPPAPPAPAPPPTPEPSTKESINAKGTEAGGRNPSQTALRKPAVNAAVTPVQLVREAEQKYLTAIAMLSRDVNRRRSQLDPMMLARLDASLAEIDRTIRETREVVKSNPDDPIALQYLLAAYSKKVDVLREMTND